MKWVTRERPVIDRIACPWLIKKFIDKEAEFLFVPPADVMKPPRKRAPRLTMCRVLSSPMWATAAASTPL
jgi:hypothetical protein